MIFIASSFILHPSSLDKAITLGHPSYVWRFGQDRRLNMIRAYLEMDNARVLDIGCGIGTYVEKFRALDANAFGVDVDAERVTRGRRETKLIAYLAHRAPGAHGDRRG